MAEIRVKLDLSIEQMIRLHAAMMNDIHGSEEMVRYWAEHNKAEYAEFYRVLAAKSRMIKEAIESQLREAKNVYIGGCEDESARA